jgi:glycosyltransferase involved in cell wall biosynthesis
MGAGDRAILIENVMGGDVEDAPQLTASTVRSQWGIAADAPLVLYTGTFEPYQGLDMLIEAMAIVARTRPDVRLLVVGGREEQVANAKAKAAALEAPAVFTGYQPARDIPAYVEAGDILASPRIKGTNTPLKIYSYLRSRKPIVATNLLTHTQVLDDSIAMLVATDPEAFASGIERLLADPVLRARIADAAAERARTRYSRESYVSRTHTALTRLVAAAPSRA